jgi:hypothetical protein
LPVVSLTIDYRRPLQHGDSVDIESMVGAAQGLRIPGAAGSWELAGMWLPLRGWSLCWWNPGPIPSGALRSGG